MDTYTRYIEVTSVGIREARRKKGFNQDELGKKVLLSRQTINAYENRRQEIPTQMIYHLCEVLEISPTDLMQIPTPEEIVEQATVACEKLAKMLLRASGQPPQV